MTPPSRSNTRPPKLHRRQLLTLGGLQVMAGSLDRASAAAPPPGEAPAGSARQVLFINIEGGMSQVDTLDAKEGPWTPDYFDIRPAGNGLKLPMGLMPQLPSVLDRLTVIRSMAAWDAVHGRAQYYIQTGHPLNLALAREVPAIGAVVCHELAKTRRPSDTLPAYLAMNMAGNQAGLVNQGFLPAAVGPLNLSVNGQGNTDLTSAGGAAGSLDRRYRRLLELDEALRKPDPRRERGYVDYHEYYAGAWALLNDPRVAGIFQLSPEERRRYGSSGIGNSLLLARNLFKADAGTRFILASHGGWDHHGDIYKEGSRNHPVLIRELDAAVTQLIRDLSSTPSPSQPGKTLLDETLIIAMSEFGRTPGPISPTRQGREHFIHVHCGFLAGGGVKGGQVLGATDPLGGKIIDPGWSGNRPIYMEDIACTLYSALGIDWKRTIHSTPSGRAFHYVEPASATQYVRFQPVRELFRS